MKKIIVFLAVAFLLSLPVYASDGNYSEYYNGVDTDVLLGSLTQETREFFAQNGIDPQNYNWVNNLTDKNVIAHIFEFITGGIKRPLVTAVTVIGIILIIAAISAFGDTQHSATALYVAAFAICAIVATDIWQSITAAVDALKGVSGFMLSFVPIFAGVLAVSGKTVTAASAGALLLGACEVISYISSFVVLPLMGGYLAISISSGVSPLLENSGIVEGIKKLSMWIMTLISTLFVGIISVQTVVNSAADSVSMKTAKFILGTSVPVVGNALSEAVTTVSSSMGLLKSSIGIYGVVALTVILLPIIIELVMWRVVLMMSSALSGTFNLKKVTGILKAIDSMLSMLLGVMLFVGGLFIISLTVVVTAGGTSG